MYLRRALYLIPKIIIICCYLPWSISINADNTPSKENEKSEEKQILVSFEQGNWSEVERVLLDELSDKQNRAKLHEQIAFRLYGENPCPGHIFIDWERMSTPKNIAFVDSSRELKVAKMTYYPVRKFLLASPQRFLGSTTNRPSNFVLEKQVDVKEQLSIEWGSKVAVETCLRWTDAFQIYGNSVVFKSSSKLITHGKGLFISSKSLNAEIGSEINLSPDATSFEELAGTSAPAPNGANLDGIVGGNGKSGFAGGDLVIRTHSLAQIPKVISRGGKGGTGGHGSNGKNAVPGGPGAGNCPPEQGFELNYSPGKCGGVLTQNGHIIAAYKWLGEINDPGGANGRDAVRAGAAGPGGIGGIGGNGGNGGNISIEYQQMTSSEQGWDIDLTGGIPGANGGHGTPGEGASGGGGVCKYWEQWESCGSFNSRWVLGIGKKGADASRGSVASYTQTNSSGVNGKIDKRLVTDPLKATQLSGIVLQHLILQANDLFRQGSASSLLEARVKYDEILSLYPDIERAFQKLTLGRIIALADREANGSQLANNATDYSKIKIQFGKDVDYLFNAFHHRFLILAGLNYFGYSNEFVPSQSYEQIRIQFNELLAKYRNLYQKREFTVKELLAKLKEQKKLDFEIQIKELFDVPGMQTKIYSAKSGVKEGYRELDQLADQYRSKLRNLKFHQDYYQAMKNLPVSSSMPNEFMSIIQAGSLGVGAAGLPGAAIGVGLGVLDQENRSAYNEIRQQMSANENSLKLAALQNDISNLDDSLREHRAIQERAGIHLGVLINEEIIAEAEADRMDFYLNRLRSQSDNFLTELDPPTLYESNLQEYNKRLSILTFFLVKSFEYKWKTKVTENELAVSLNLISPEDFDHFASNLDWHESKLMENRGRPGINASEISNSSYNKYYVIYEFSDQSNSKLFESFKKTGLIDFKVNFDTESAENSDLAFPSSHESAEIITADIWYSGVSCRMSEEPFIVESSEVERFFSVDTGKIIEFHAPNHVRKSLIPGRSADRLGTQDGSTFDSPDFRFVESKIFGVNHDAKSLFFPQRSPVTSWEITTKNERFMNCVEKIKFVIVYRFLLGP